MPNSQVGVNRGQSNFMTNEPNNGPAVTPRSGQAVSQAPDVSEDEVKLIPLVIATKQSDKCQSATIDAATRAKVGNRGKRAASPYAAAGNEQKPRKRQRKDSAAHSVPNASTANENDVSRVAFDGVIRNALHWPIDQAVKLFTYMASYFRQPLPPANMRGWLQKDDSTLPKSIKKEELDDE
ncbi:hypothetical protein BC567DRAFT_212111 [Phyllosticta citribraziliensis]